MKITFQQVSKRYRYDWVFKNIDYSFEEAGRYAVTGPNGSGKSTLMKLLSGHLSPSKGKAVFFWKNKKVEAEDVYLHISFAAPYIDLIEEFTLLEILDFHQKFKPFQKGLASKNIVELLAFPKSKNKEVRHFSSGMKQRLKLALAICSDSSLLLLDEPTTNLDKQGVDWYLDLIENYLGNRTAVVASNIDVDYAFCGERLDILAYK
ncbi:MAG TPA: ABC transporter ATP-binding protein [Bacteroidetes bacterium]|nr:ABC transporter ATP-binding protein [Bacteroidota bacterium]